MRKNRTMKLAALLLVLTLITSCFVGGTFAKYTSTATATDTVEVANWDVKINDGDFSVFESASFPVVLKPGMADQNFEISVSNSGDVDALVDIAYSLKDSNGNVVSGPFTVTTDKFENGQTLAKSNGELTANIGFSWAYERGSSPEEKATNNAADTAFGKTASDLTLTITVTATQKQ